MKDIIYQIEFFDFWHVGSGLTGGSAADAIVNKDKEGFPYIPGKTLKGLLRDAAEQLADFNHSIVNAKFTDEIFGIKPSKDSETSGGINGKMPCFFTNAYLDQTLASTIIQKSQMADLYAIHASTAIEENGLAKKNTLRHIEVTVPIILYAKILEVPDDKITGFHACLAMVKRMGTSRTRGLGRCQLTII